VIFLGTSIALGPSIVTVLCCSCRALAVWLQKVDPKTDGAARDWVAIYDECSRILYQEIDYTLEGKNADRFRENFANVDWVKVSVKLMMGFERSP
jgi:hypothetical protein